MPGLFKNLSPEQLMAAQEAEESTNKLAAQVRALNEQDKLQREAEEKESAKRKKPEVDDFALAVADRQRRIGTATTNSTTMVGAGASSSGALSVVQESEHTTITRQIEQSEGVTVTHEQEERKIDRTVTTFANGAYIRAGNMQLFRSKAEETIALFRKHFTSEIAVNDLSRYPWFTS